MSSDLFCYAAGRLQPMSSAGVPVNDLAVQRGYGLFDFMRVSQNMPLFLEDHLDRFFQSAREMHMECPVSREDIVGILKEVLTRNALQESGVRLILTGGPSPDGYTPVAPDLVVLQMPIAPPPSEMVTKGLVLVSYPHQRQLPHVKSIDYLMAVWLQPWLKERGGDDLVYHSQGWVRECPRSNIFLVTRQGVLVTPGEEMLSGVTRKHILLSANDLGIPVEERDVRLDEFSEAAEAFISSSTKRLIPVRRLDAWDIPVPAVTGAESVSERIWQRFYEREAERLAHWSWPV